MIKILALQTFRDLKAGIIRRPNFVFDSTKERLEELKVNLGEGFVVEVAIVEETIDDPFKDAETGEFVEEEVISYPNHVGGGNYELSNGERIKGKDAAIEAEKALKE